MITYAELRNKIPLTEYLLSLGYELQKGEGFKFPVYHNKLTDDKVFIINKDNPGEMGFCNQRNPGDKGTLIDFVISRTDDGLIFRTDNNIHKHVNNVLSQFLGLSQEEREKYKPSPVMMEKKIIIKSTEEIKNILVKLENKAFLFARKLTDVELKNAVFKNRIFNPNPAVEDAGYKTNVLFPLYDKEDRVVGVSARNRDFKSMMEGSDKENGFWRSNAPENVKTMLVTESAIDCLSFAALYSHPKETMYASGEGAFSDNQIDSILDLRDKHKIDNFYLGFDNDKAGAKYELKFMLAQLRRNGVDWEYSKGKSNQLSVNIYSGKENNILAAAIQNYNREVDKIEKGDVENSNKIGVENIDNGLKLSCNVHSHYALSHLANVLNKSFNLNIKRTRPILNDWNDDLKCYRELRKEGKFLVYKDMKPLLKEKQEEINKMTSKPKMKARL